MLQDEQLVKWGKLLGNASSILGLVLLVVGTALYFLIERIMGGILEKNLLLSEKMLAQVTVDDPKGFIPLIIDSQRNIDAGMVEALSAFSFVIGSSSVLLISCGLMSFRTRQLVLEKRVLEQKLKTLE